MSLKCSLRIQRQHSAKNLCIIYSRDLPRFRSVVNIQESLACHFTPLHPGEELFYICLPVFKAFQKALPNKLHEIEIQTYSYGIA